MIQDQAIVVRRNNVLKIMQALRKRFQEMSILQAKNIAEFFVDYLENEHRK